MAKSKWLEQHLLDALFYGATMPTFPNTWYIGLYSTSPVQGNDAAGVELSGSGYARAAALRGSTVFGTSTQSGSSPAQTKNIIVINCFTATGALATAVAFGMFDAITGGNLWYWGSANNPTGLSISSGDKIVLNTGDLTIQET